MEKIEWEQKEHHAYTQIKNYSELPEQLKFSLIRNTPKVHYTFEDGEQYFSIIYPIFGMYEAYTNVIPSDTHRFDTLEEAKKHLEEIYFNN